MYLLIDNYDSFSYNLYQLIGAFDPDVAVARNDALTLEDIAALSPRAIFLSPGPGRPEASGICPAAVRRFAGDIPIFASV
ncbi:MAG: glutamine amidotransferase-related protein [Cloacibacillus evryensis]